MTPTPYRTRIEHYCQTHGITIPIGFYRHSASRYAAIDLGHDPPKLIATTWFKQEDLLYYLSQNQERNYQLLDFKNNCGLIRKHNRLIRGTPFLTKDSP